MKLVASSLPQRSKDGLVFSRHSSSATSFSYLPRSHSSQWSKSSLTHSREWSKDYPDLQPDPQTNPTAVPTSSKKLGKVSVVFPKVITLPSFFFSTDTPNDGSGALLRSTTIQSLSQQTNDVSDIVDSIAVGFLPQKSKDYADRKLDSIVCSRVQQAKDELKSQTDRTGKPLFSKKTKDDHKLDLVPAFPQLQQSKDNMNIQLGPTDRLSIFKQVEDESYHPPESNGIPLFSKIAKDYRGRQLDSISVLLPHQQSKEDPDIQLDSVDAFSHNQQGKKDPNIQQNSSDYLSFSRQTDGDMYIPPDSPFSLRVHIRNRKKT